MSRNGSGTYTLPQSAFTPNTTISSAAMNSDLSDIATALTASICTDGQTPITGQLKAALGANPQYSFTGSTTSGFGSDTAGHAQIQAGGVKVFDSTSTTVAITGITTITGATTVTGALHVTGACTFDAAVAITTATTTTENVTTLNVSGIQTNSATSHWFPPNGTTGQRSGAPTAGMERYNSTLSGIEFYNGSAWVILGQSPTVQRVMVTGSGTYIPSTGAVRARIRMSAAGGGPGNSNLSNAGTDGGDTTFGAAGVGQWIAKGGKATGNGGGVAAAGQDGNIGTKIFRVNGGSGGFTLGGNTNALAGFGGVGPLGGMASQGGASSAGGNGGANGAGGAGGSNGGEASVGAGAGEWVEFWYPITGNVAYSVGAGGPGGAISGAHKAGGNGFDGCLIIEEYYA